MRGCGLLTCMRKEYKPSEALTEKDTMPVMMLTNACVSRCRRAGKGHTSQSKTTPAQLEDSPGARLGNRPPPFCRRSRRQAREQTCRHFYLGLLCLMQGTRGFRTSPTLPARGYSEKNNKVLSWSQHRAHRGPGPGAGLGKGLGPAAGNRAWVRGLVRALDSGRAGSGPGSAVGFPVRLPFLNDMDALVRTSQSEDML